jgi:hypothetical protein
MSIPTIDRPNAHVVSDLDGDGVPDLAVASETSDTRFNFVRVLLARGDGTFETPTEYPVGRAPKWLSVGDLQGDGVPDLVTANDRSDDVSVLLGVGDGTFEPAVSYPCGPAPESVAIADLDGDGAMDLIVANKFSDVVTVLAGRGDGSFAAGESFVTGDYPSLVIVADLDGNGLPDLVTTNRRSVDLSVLLNVGDGQFGQPTHLPLGGVTGGVAAADLDGDGVLDLVTPADLLLGRGDGSFAPAIRFGVGGTRVSVADLDDDDLPDLAIYRFEAGVVSVLLSLRDPVLPARIDIKPGDALNVVPPLGRGRIPVAILGSDTIDVTEIDPETVRFGPSDARAVQPGDGRFGDVNRDGWLDVTLEFRIPETGIESGDIEACASGKLRDDRAFKGCDSITTTPLCGTGFETAIVFPIAVLIHRRRRRQ